MRGTVAGARTVQGGDRYPVTGVAGLLAVSGVRGRTSDRVVVLGLPPVGANVVATVSRSAPRDRATRARLPIRQVRVYVPARVAVFFVEHSVVRLRATPVVDTLAIPGPGNWSTVVIAIVEFVVEIVGVLAVKAFAGRENVAVTERASDMASVQVGAAPVQEPVQPANVEPFAAVAVNVTDW